MSKSIINGQAVGFEAVFLRDRFNYSDYADANQNITFKLFRMLQVSNAYKLSRIFLFRIVGVDLKFGSAISVIIKSPSLGCSD